MLIGITCMCQLSNNGQPHGKVISIDIRNKYQYQGECKNGMHLSKEWTVYDESGEPLNGNRQNISFPVVNYGYTGNWKNGKLHGLGTLTLQMALCIRVHGPIVDKWNIHCLL